MTTPAHLDAHARARQTVEAITRSCEDYRRATLATWCESLPEPIALAIDPYLAHGAIREGSALALALDGAL